jgi:type IV secretory pathway VirB2 component (pilin)
MTSMGDVTNRAGQAGQQAHNSEWFDKAVKAGLIAYGVVHLLVVWLALQLAFGEREGKASSSGAMQQLAEQPFGTVLLWLVGLGMFTLVLWKGLDAAFGHQDEDGGKLWAKRAADVFKAILYAVIGISAITTAVGSGGKGGGGTDSITQKIMELPGGQILVVLVGLAIIAYGGNYVRKAFNEKFREKIAASGPSGAPGKASNAYVYFGKAGYTAKGIAVAIVGVLFAYAGITHDPKKSGGLDQALQEVLDAPAGPVILVLIALGIICYGLFQFARAMHHTGK